MNNAVNISDIINLCCEIVAAIIGLLILKKIKPGYRQFVYYIVVVAIVEIVGHVIRWGGEKSVYIYTAFLLFDNIFQLYIAGKLLKLVWQRGLIILFGCIFLTIYILNLLSFQSLYDYPKEAFLADFITLIVVYLLLLYKEVMDPSSRVLKSPVGLIATGSLLFYGCSLSYFAMYDFLGRSITLNQQLLLAVFANSFSAIRYIMYSYGLYLCRK